MAAIASPPPPAAQGTVNSYLVSFNRPYTETDGEGAQDPLMPNSSGTATPQSQAASSQAVSTVIATRSDQDQAQDICASYGATFDHVFSGADAFLARMTDAQAQAMITDSRIAIIEPDIQVELSSSQTLADATDAAGHPELLHWQWGLDAIDQKGGTPDYLFKYTNDGSNAATGAANVFVVGTGIWSGHPDLGGRVTLDQNLVDPTQPALDASDDGHDTIAATIIGGDTCGVAKLAKIHAVKVGVSATNASLSKVVDGMAWVLNNYKSYVGPSVVHCSFLANKSKLVATTYVGPTYPKNKNDSVATCLEKITNSLLSAGVPVVAPAGNKSDDVKNWARKREWRYNGRRSERR